MASAVQQAPQRPAGAGGGNRQNQAKKAEPRGGFLAGVPQAAGVGVMLVLLVMALFVGNFRALAGAAPKDFMRYGAVESIVEDRLDAARNAKMVAARAQLDELLLDPVENALYALENADGAREISRADQDLTAAVSAMVTAAAEKLDEENKEMLQSAADDFAEQGSFLRQEARSYNEKALKAQALYEKLPTRFVLPEPQVYEGV